MRKTNSRLTIGFVQPNDARDQDSFALRFGIQNDRFVDANTGLPLDEGLCLAARKKDIDYFKSKVVWEMRSVKKARAKMGRSPISGRWIEINKGDDQAPNIRSRFVAREIRTAGKDVIFAPVPPLESLRMIRSMTTTKFESGKGLQPCWDHSEKKTQLLMIDISRAYFNAKTDKEDPTYVEFPSDMGAPPGMCGLLRRHMYGTRRAAEGWQA